MAAYGQRTMMAAGFTGYPARIFFEMTNYGRGTQSHLEKMVILEKWYSHLRAYLPVHYENKKDEYNKEIAPKLAEAAIQIQAMNNQYDPAFEGIATCNQFEKDFCHVMRGVFEILDEITAISKVIDNQRMETMEQIG